MPIEHVIHSNQNWLGRRWFRFAVSLAETTLTSGPDKLHVCTGPRHLCDILMLQGRAEMFKWLNPTLRYLCGQRNNALTLMLCLVPCSTTFLCFKGPGQRWCDQRRAWCPALCHRGSPPVGQGLAPVGPFQRRCHDTLQVGGQAGTWLPQRLSLCQWALRTIFL